MTLPTLVVTGDPSWSQPTLILGPILAFVLLLCLAALVIGVLMERDNADGLGIAVGGGITFLVVAVLGFWGFYPLNAEYHQWTPTTGVVKTADKRLVGTGDGMEEKFVVTFEGSGQQYGCNDTRCAAIRPGDELTITCKRSWQFAGVDGFDCNFVSTEAVR